jgi:hypothetical protein
MNQVAPGYRRAVKCLSSGAGERIALRHFVNFYLFITWNRVTGRLPASGILNTGVQGIGVEGNKKESEGDSLSGIT